MEAMEARKIRDDALSGKMTEHFETIKRVAEEGKSFIKIYAWNVQQEEMNHLESLGYTVERPKGSDEFYISW
jgi:hypothetical protein